MSSLNPVDIDISVGKHGTAHWTDTHCALLHSHLGNDLCHELVHHAVAATRAVVHRRVVDQSRTSIYLVFGLNDFVAFHNLLYFNPLTTLTISSGDAIMPPLLP